MTFLREHQLEIMLFLVGVCANLALFAVFFRAVQPGRKRILVGLSLCSMWLLLSDYLGWTYLGNASLSGYVLVRFCNFSVFLATILLIHLFNYYIANLCVSTSAIGKVPKRLKFTNICGFVGEFLIIFNSFTGIYYTFDENNVYQRSDTILISYVCPLVMIFTQLSVVITYYKKFRKLLRLSILLFSIVPLVASGMQFFMGDISFTDMAIVVFVIVLHMFVVVDVNREMREMHDREINLLHEEQKRDYLLISQTASALSGAIEAKDMYTHGHSTRVAKYAEMIARLAGEPDDCCEQIYLSAMLHDVGKIGVPESIINKPGKLTESEYNIMKEHPVLGSHILANIQVAPALSIGALYHHERFDGKGYPDGLAGEEIPKIARIIAVADAYDAMTSKRSYRGVLAQATVREQIEHGKGTQFDPMYADIMLKLMDRDIDYQLREPD